ncbi:MAG: hydantoinase/oxoprolinase family protein [Alphaproteobacteria bacterium]|nr:hydantoinase/oxoprolinase family protein [Alphaproteobacteria bacterium]MBV9554505.1 hydantoinase/oxoprolinase family protein [Alphaproteobacteria bacterium]
MAKTGEARRGVARLGVDIGGTFTDVALESDDARYSAKLLTTPHAPERGVLAAIHAVLDEAGLAPQDLSIIIHGTTLATNAIIERKGATTALVTTEGFRDTIEIRHENRFEQYDVNIDLPPPLVPRRLRFVVPERIDARGRVVTPLDENAVVALAERLDAAGVESVAIGFLHSYVNPAHEQRTRELLMPRLGGVTMTLSSDVSPEMREYERLSTACANAYVQPMMGRYLVNLEALLQTQGFVCPLFLMTSGGGLTTVETAIRFPVRLVESGPAGGAIFAVHIARQCKLDKVLSYDMGGTTAKICLIDDYQPQTSRAFEVARVYRFKKGSGLPLRIPVIEMVEIGAGGGSIARVDRLKRITVGPDSAGADPGPACYGQGGDRPSVTDADLLLGRIDPAGFSGGRMALDRDAAEGAMRREVAGKLDLALELAALGVSEIVDENMANAARVHAIESGKDARGRTLVAFGGAAPLHASRMADKLGLDRVLVPSNAGVGSAVGFLRAPISYEIVRSQLQRLDAFDPTAANALLATMYAEAEAIVRRGAADAPLTETRSALMRYRGQGHEIAVPLTAKTYRREDAAEIVAAFEEAYRRLYSRVIPGVEVEVLSWVVLVTAPEPRSEERLPALPAAFAAAPSRRRAVFDPETAEFVDVAIYERTALQPGATIPGPAVVVEDETSTVVGRNFDARVDARGYIELTRRGA